MARAGVKAWLIRWDWAGPHAAVERPLIALFRPQTGAETVRRFVEHCYASASYEADELLEYMLHPARNPYPAQFGTCQMVMEDGSTSLVTWTGEVVCGHNPFVYARAVQNLKPDPTVVGLGVTWENVERPALDLRGSSELSRRRHAPG